MTYTGPVIDCHVHLELLDGMRVGRDPHPLVAYQRSVDALELAAAGALVMAPPGDLDRTRRLNDAVLELAQDPPWYALCSVHPGDLDAAVAEIDRVSASGAAGLKLHPNTQAFDLTDPGVGEIVAYAGERGLPVLFDGYSPTDPAQPGKFLQLVMSNPQTQIVIAHALFMRFAELHVYPILARYPQFTRNVWVDVSAVAAFYARSPWQAQLAWTLRTFGTDRVLWGSDYPLDDPLESLAALDCYGFTAEERRAICHDNARSLYDL